MLGFFLTILLLSQVPGASAHSGQALSAFGTATVDGVISAGEYGSCLTTTQVWWDYTFMICETNDNTNDYYAFQINDYTFGGDSVSFWFDNAHDGVVSPVSTGPTEDMILVGGSGIFGDDGYRYAGAGLSAGADPIQNGVGAVIFTPGTPGSPGAGYVYEASHPLNSGDSNDYSLSLSSTVGWCLTYEDAADHPGPVSPDVEYPTGCYTAAKNSGDASKYGNILKKGISSRERVVEASGTGLGFAVIAVGAGVAAAAGGLAVAISQPRSEVYAFAWHYYCRKHRTLVWSVEGRLWCPVERRFLKP